MAKDYLQEFETIRRGWGTPVYSPATVDQAKQYYKIVQNQTALDALNGIAAPESESYEEYFKRKQRESMPQGISQTVDYGKAADSTEEDTAVKVKDSSLNEEENNKKQQFEDFLNNSTNENDLIAGYNQSGKAGYGDPFNIQWPKSGTLGPGYKAPESKPPEPKSPTKSASSETPESRYENFVAQVTPGPSGYTDPRSYDPRGIIPIITPGSKFKPGEGYNLIDPFKNSPSTGPGLSETPEKTYENFVAKVTPQTSSVSKDETLNKYEGLLTQLKKSKDTQTEGTSSSTEEFSNTVSLLNDLNVFEDENKLMATEPSGPYTPLPTEGWNPNKIKTPGDPKFRPSPIWDKINPRGQRVPFA